MVAMAVPLSPRRRAAWPSDDPAREPKAAVGSWEEEGRGSIGTRRVAATGGGGRLFAYAAAAVGDSGVRRRHGENSREKTLLRRSVDQAGPSMAQVVVSSTPGAGQ